MVEEKKLKTFCDFCGARATLCGDPRGRGSKTGDFCTILASRARPCGDPRADVKKAAGFVYDSCGARAALCRDRACRCALAALPCEFVLVSANPLRRSCVSKRSRCGGVRFPCSRNGLWKLSRGSCNPAPAGKSQLLSTCIS